MGGVAADILNTGVSPLKTPPFSGQTLTLKSTAQYMPHPESGP